MKFITSLLGMIIGITLFNVYAPYSLHPITINQRSALEAKCLESGVDKLICDKILN